MDTLSSTTKVNGIEYGYTVQQFESLQEAVDEMGEEVAVENLNSLQDQNGKQGPKSGPREAVDEAVDAGYDRDTIQSAVDEWQETGELPSDPVLANVCEEIGDAQESTAGYVLGKPRGRSDGITKTKAREIGEKMREVLSEEELLQHAEELGIEI